MVFTTHSLLFISRIVFFKEFITSHEVDHDYIQAYILLICYFRDKYFETQKWQEEPNWYKKTSNILAYIEFSPLIEQEVIS